MKKLCTDEMGRVKMKTENKCVLQFVKKHFIFLLFFFGCSFGFAFQR